MDLNKYQFLKELKKIPVIEKIWLYGSWARGDARLNSDIDLAIDCPGANDFDWQQIKNIISEADTLRGIDVVRFDTLQAGAFKNTVMRDKKLIYQRNNNE